VSVDIHGDYVPPVIDTDTGGGSEFWVLVGFQMPFDPNDQDAASALAQGGMESLEGYFNRALTDPSAWHRVSPLLFAFTGGGLNYYSAAQFQSGERWAAEVSLSGTGTQGQALSGGGAFLVVVEGVFNDWNSAARAFANGGGTGDPREAVMPFNRADGRTDKVYDNDRSSWRIAGGPLQEGWSQQSMRRGVDLMMSFVSFIDVGALECFLATSVYETASSPELTRLRLFRDEVLEPTRGGKALVDAYYNYGPRMAAWVDGHPESRVLLRPLMDQLAGILGTVTEDTTLAWAARLALSSIGPYLERIAPDFSFSDYARLYLPWTEETVLFRVLQER
jgi:hypothetical protein